MLSRRAASAELIELRYFCSTASVESKRLRQLRALADESRSATYCDRPRLSSSLGDRLQQIWPVLPPQLLALTPRFVSVDRMHQSRSRSATSALEGRGSCHRREAGMELRGAFHREICQDSKNAAIGTLIEQQKKKMSAPGAWIFWVSPALAIMPAGFGAIGRTATRGWIACRPPLLVEEPPCVRASCAAVFASCEMAREAWPA
jgi:DNA-binding FadR family transcriptional regulator